MKRHTIKLTKRRLASLRRVTPGEWENLNGLIDYPLDSDARECCALAILLQSRGEAYPIVPACLKAGQHVSELLASLKDRVRDELSI